MSKSDPLVCWSSTGSGFSLSHTWVEDIQCQREGGGTGDLLLRQRALVQDVTVYYSVNVVRDDNKKFEPLIMQGIRNSYNVMLSQIL